MNKNGNTMPLDAEYLKKLGLFFRCLLALDLLFFAYTLGGYVHGAEDLSALVDMFGQVFLVSSMVLGNMAQLSPNDAKAKNVAVFILLACSFGLLFFRFKLP